MAVVMESDILPVIMINAGGGNNRPAKVSADLFDNDIRVAFVRLGINIKPVFIFLVTEGFCLFNGRKREKSKSPQIPLMNEGRGELMCRRHFFTTFKGQFLRTYVWICEVSSNPKSPQPA